LDQSGSAREDPGGDLVGGHDNDDVVVLAESLFVLTLNYKTCLQASALMQLFMKPNARFLMSSATAAAGDEQSGTAGECWGDAGEGFRGDIDDNDQGFGGGADDSCECLCISCNLSLCQKH